MHLMGLPHDFEIGNVNQLNHIAQNVSIFSLIYPFCLEAKMNPSNAKLQEWSARGDGFLLKNK